MARLLIVEDNHELGSLIAAAAEARGHTATVAHTGTRALQAASEAPFELAVVDLLLPDLRGGEVLRKLKEAKIPAIAMSGVYRGERYAREATEVHGAIAFFEKPFELAAVFEAIEARTGVPEQPEPAGGDLEGLAELEELQPIEEEEEEGAAPEEPLGATSSAAVSGDEPLGVTDQTAEAEAEAGGLAADLAPGEAPFAASVESSASEVTAAAEAPQEEQPAGGDEQEGARGGGEARPTEAAAPPVAEPEAEGASGGGEGAHPEAALSEGLVRVEPRRSWSAAASSPSAPDRQLPEWSQAGDLSRTSVPRLLTAYYQARHSGELKLRRRKVVKVVYVENGQPAYAASNVAQERFARFCVQRGVLDEKDLARIAQKVEGEGIRTGQAMMALGLLDADQRRSLLEDQVREIIWSTFGWEEGEFSFSARRPQRSDLVKLSVFPGDLILQGVLRSTPLVLLRKRVGAKRRLFPCADPPYLLHQIQLDGAQARLLAHADGSKTVADLLTLADLPEREALATLWGFELLGLLEERRDEGAVRRISFGL